MIGHDGENHPALRNAALDKRADDPWIELLRGLAAGIVVYAHYWQVAGWSAGPLRFSYTGVDLFFVLSGFVFAPAFYRAPPRLLPFLTRRLFRIYPLYVVGVILYAVLRWGTPELPMIVLKHLSFLHTWQSYEIAFALNPAFWSLPPEVEFYLALPILSRVFQRDRGICCLVLVAVGSRVALAASLPESGGISVPLVLGAHLPGILSEFACGIAAWRLAQAVALRPWRPLIILAGIAALAGLASIFVRVGESVHEIAGLRGLFDFYAAMAYACVVVGLARRGVESRAASAVMHGFGRLSFGVYIFHNAALFVAMKLTGWSSGSAVVSVAFALTIIAAASGHLLVEEPLRRAGRRWAARMERHSESLLDKAD